MKLRNALRRMLIRRWHALWAEERAQLEANINAVCAYADKLEAKLEAIECAQCEKSMLECECEESE